VEMLNVYLIRNFVADLVNHMAQTKGGAKAATLAPDLRRALGIGNSTGLGMAPFLINHPVLINNWIAAKEEALARVRSLPKAQASEVARFRKLAQRALVHAQNWQSDHPYQQGKLTELRNDMQALCTHLEAANLQDDQPWNRLWIWAETALGLEGQEQLVSLLLEPYGELVDGLECCLSADEEAYFRIDGSITVAQMIEHIKASYDWAKDIAWDTPQAQARVWYTSQEKLEPRLGQRFEEPLEPYEQPLCPARDVMRAMVALQSAPSGSLAGFLMAHPEHRHAIRRAQITAKLPFAEI